MGEKTNPLLDVQAKVLSVTYNHNMAVLEKEMPDVYKYYQNYSPQNTHLIFDENGFVNLLSNDQLVYQDNPLLEINKQVDHFIQAPMHYKYQIEEGGTFDFEHERVLRGIVNKRKSDVDRGEPYNLTQHEEIDFIAFMGSGLGYHLESLFQNFKIRSALVYEPDPDCFYATLHTIDIKKLIEGCRQNGGQLTLKIGGDSSGFVNEIASIFIQQGYFNIARLCLYRHYMSDKTYDAFKKVSELAYRYVSSWGFCEDEITSISHTLTNISELKFPSILATAKSNNRKQPVFIIGNGPSLDASYDYLRKNRSSAVYLSCGTALKPLLENGIVPDAHIEMERVASLYKWIDKIGHKEKLKEIDIICLNTVYPKVLKLFKQAHLLLKPNDAGTTFIQNYISEKYSEVYNCNPTVTNAASSAAVAMGFKNLYLFGVDYGFKSEEHHHSKDSLYYSDNKALDFSKITGTLEVDANFGGTVLTNNAFDNSRAALERLLVANSSVSCVNTSDGAKIKFSISCQISDLPIFEPIQNHSVFVDSFLNESFNNSHYKNAMYEFESFLPQFSADIKKLISFTEGVVTRSDLVDAFYEQHKFVKNIDVDFTGKLFQRFIKGTLNYLQTTIMSNVYFYADKKQQEKYIQFCLTTMSDHFKWLLNDLTENYNKPARL